MHRKAIHRGGILSAGFDEASRTLEVEFDTHRVIRYEGVDRETARRFLNSDRPLSHLRDEIEDEYPSHEIDPVAAKKEAPRKKGSSNLDALNSLFGGK